MTMDVDGTRNDGINGGRSSSPPIDRDPFRCKLYRLSKEDAWEDLGTGFVKVELGQDPGHLQVVKELPECREDSKEIILISPIMDPRVYQLQGDPGKETIIVWEDADCQDFALSLEDHEDTKSVWNVLSGHEKRDVGAVGPPSRKELQSDSAILPTPSFKTLGDLVSILNRPLPPAAKDALATGCMNDAWLEQLCQVFHDAEDIENPEALAQLFHIVKGMFLVARTPLTERLMRKDCFHDFVGMLEFDDGIPPEKRYPHRKLLSVDIKYRAVITFTDEHILDKIHLNYRMMYLRDHILPRMIDDSVFMMLLQRIYANTSEILRYLEGNPSLLDQLFSQVKDGDLQSLDFIQDCCRQMRTPGFRQEERETLYATMVQRDLFGVLIPFISKPRRLPLPGRRVPHANSRAIALDILHMHAYHSPAHLQKYTIANPPFLSSLIGMLMQEEDSSQQSLVAEIVRWIMDFSCSHNPMGQTTNGAILTNDEKQNFLSVLYDRNGPLPALVAFFRDNISTSNENSNFGKQMVCEIMATGLLRNDYHSKYFVMTQQFPLHVMKLFLSPQKFLHHAAVRVIRAVVKRDDEQCARYLIKSSEAILKPLIQILENYLESQRRTAKAFRTSGNIVVSSILDTLNIICDTNQKELLKHLCETYSIFQLSPPVSELTKFVIRHQKNVELALYPPDQGYQCGAPMTGRGDASEENALREAEYFEESEEEADEANKLNSLFAYDDEPCPPKSPEEVTSDRKRLKREVD
eukprot:GEMP01006000.1.p1 GENE.GEMP01006000.1~~GEMP01006000.1.p1  ORF type:complete len:751 (+),score=120.15 GEMP01006000.1:47-2299(+)